MRLLGLIAAGGLALSGCATGTGTASGGDLGPPQMSDDLMMGGRYKEPWLSAALKEAANHPLGSNENPVRADMPRGQQAYLSRLRCSDGQRPSFNRSGNLGAGVFGSIIDAYDVRCAGGSPAQTVIIMDMYFGGYVERQAVAGFTITPP